MSNVVDLFTRRELAVIDDTAVMLPKTSTEYLVVCRNTLPESMYRDILCGIMDMGYYEKLSDTSKKIVDSYYSFER